MYSKSYKNEKDSPKSQATIANRIKGRGSDIFLFILSSLLALPAPAGQSSVQVEIHPQNSWIKIRGEAARELFVALQVPESNQGGEAGPTLFFKEGESYRCFRDSETLEHTCDIFIANPATGKIDRGH